MKHSGLKNRFPPKVRVAWQGHDACHLCGKNCWDSLHHIISPSCAMYIPGIHNRSILNSAPLHNFAHPIDMQDMSGKRYCHFGNEAMLTKVETVIWMLHTTYRALQALGYKFNDIDNQFLFAYSEFYLMDTPAKPSVTESKPLKLPSYINIYS